jgi:hypothetical protein
MSEKTLYQKRIRTQLEGLEARVNELQAKAEGTKADLKGQYLEAIGDLRSKQSAAQEKLADLEKAGEQAWSDLRSGVDQAVDDLASALEGVSERVSRGI